MNAMPPATAPVAVPPSAPYFPSGLRGRVVASIGIVFGATIVLLLYLGFLAPQWPWYSNLAVVLVLFLGGFGALAALWASWGLRFLRANGGRLAGSAPGAPPIR